MKHLLFGILVIVFSLSVHAKQVDVQTAQRVGLSYYFEHAGQFVPVDIKSLDVSSTFTEFSDGNAVYYIFNINPKGYVIVAADDIATPVIGYSYESGLDPSKMPEGLKYWLSVVKKEIAYAIKAKISASENIKSLWDYYSTQTPENLSINKAKVIAPLLTSTWNQDIYYNQFCPAAAGGPDDKAYAGCVATAMSQIMYYYRYPTTGNGTHGGINFGTTTYQWDNMLDDLGNYNEAVATLLYHCGKAVNMWYAADGSGANSEDIPAAVEDHFRYNSTCSFNLKYTYTTTSWNNLLKANLDAKHPMVYSGSDNGSGGHAWNCDGYDASTNFHMNWGWSGYANGFYSLADLTAAGSYFGSFQGAICEFYPPTASYPSNCTGTKSVTGITGTIEDGSGPSDYTNNNDCMWLIDPAEPVSKITLSFINFATEATNDVVTVYDGSTTAAAVLGTFSGSTMPADITSTGPTMLVRFVTNGTTTNSGWKATYRSSFPIYCSGVTTLTTPTGTITDGSGPENYTYNHLCRWSIAPPNATSITLNFTDFNLATNDFVKVYDQVTNTPIDVLTGTALPAIKTYNTSAVLVMFKSDSYLNSGGFNLNYTSTISPSGLEDYGNFSGMNIFPNPASSELNIQFTVNESEHMIIELCSVTGVVVYKEEYNNFNGMYTKTINTSGLSQGVYMLRIAGDNQSLCKKVIIE